jgi:hypothetical protein
VTATGCGSSTRAAEGDRWNLVAQLGVEEFLYNTRNGERQLLYLAYHLLGDDLSSPQVQHAALWSGQMAALVGRRLIEGDRSMPNGGTTYLDRLLPRLVQLLSRDLNAPERCQVGDILGQLGDPRFRPDTWYLPDEPLLGWGAKKATIWRMTMKCPSARSPCRSTTLHANR